MTNSVRILSSGYLPSVGLTLAGSLYYNLWKENTSTDDTSSMDNGLSTWSKILVLSIARFVFMYEKNISESYTPFIFVSNLTYLDFPIWVIFLFLVYIDIKHDYLKLCFRQSAKGK